MKSNKKCKDNEKEEKTIVYDYLFNYFGGDTFKGDVVTGACVSLAIKTYKDGKETGFLEEKELKCYDKYLFDVFDVSFDREQIFVIRKNLIVDNLFRLVYGFEKIEAEVVNYCLDVLSSLPTEVKESLPKDFRNLTCSEPRTVTKEEFQEFLREHIDDFDISDNIKAQVPSVAFT